MRSVICVVTLIALTLMQPHLSHGIMPLVGDEYRPTGRLASQFDNLITRFGGDKAGYSCVSNKKSKNEIACYVALRFSITMVVIENDAVRLFGVNFGGSSVVLKDPQCTTKLFLQQIESMLENFREFPNERARKIIVTMRQDFKKFGNCKPAEMSEIDEARACLSYGEDNTIYQPGSTSGEMVLKIFLWMPKEP